MKLNLNLNMTTEKEQKAEQRVKEAVQKKKLAKYEPTWDEVWVTGYTSHTGAIKKGIFQTKISDTDKPRLIAVKEAIETGELQAGVDTLSKFTKTRALSLWKELKEIRKASIIAKMIEEKPANYHLVTDGLEFQNMLVNLGNEDIIALDTETTGIEVFGKDYVVGLSMTLPKVDQHYYIPVRHNVEDVQLDPKMVFNYLKPYFENSLIRKIYHNAKFDIHMLRKEGIECAGLYLDTQVAMHILNENEPSYALKNLATKYGKYFGFNDKSMTYEELFGRGGFENTPLDIGHIYACKDTHLTYKFGMWILEQFERLPQLKKLYFDLELPITQVCIDMEKTGMLIDLDFAEKYKQELKQEVQQLEARIKEGFGDININSNQQLGKLIYEVWGVKDKFKGSVDKSALEKIAETEKDIPQVQYIKDLLHYRDLNKLLSTYIEPLPQKIFTDGRLHGSFNQSDTVTGRFASSDPNLQNLPYPARHMFVAPKGKIIIGSDYSQIEPRFLSHITQDPDFMAPYVEGRDLYSEIASKVFKLPLEECGDGTKVRKMSKVILLGMMYGISSMSLADQFHITNQEAEDLYKEFYESYPIMKEWFNMINDQANTRGYVETFFKRKRRFIGHPEIHKQHLAMYKKMSAKLGKTDFNIWQEYISKKVTYKEAKAYHEVDKVWAKVQRQSINAVIQGSGADIMKKAMVDIWRHLKKKGSDWKMIATIHDEVLIEIPETATPEEIQEIATIQKQAVSLSIPMKCDVEVSATWGKGVSFNEWLEAGCGRKVFEK